ncbi:MAG: PIN domain-containing protein [Candidatus Acidiferrales bacterium]
MSVKTFVDTNVLVYAYDLDAGHKHLVARRLLEGLWEAEAGALSPQVLQEFYVNVTRKIARPLLKHDARAIVNTYAPWSIVVTVTEIVDAFRIEDEAGINFWDALIVASAARAGAARIVSEDLNPGQTIAGIKIESPFAGM